jgi:hypothetical protein
MGEPWVLSGIQHDVVAGVVILRFHNPNYQGPFFIKIPEDDLIDKFRPDLQEILQPVEGEPEFE